MEQVTPQELKARLDRKDPRVFCHQGIRSAAVGEYLRQLGFKKAVNLAVRLDAWAQTVDPTMPRY
jgi:rhodanese-related sulfurtransferase